MANKQATKEQADHDAETSFERFEAFAKRLLAVPKHELEELAKKEAEASQAKRQKAAQTQKERSD